MESNAALERIADDLRMQRSKRVFLLWLAVLLTALMMAGAIWWLAVVERIVS